MDQKTIIKAIETVDRMSTDNVILSTCYDEFEGEQDIIENIQELLNKIHHSLVVRRNKFIK